ncbi:hypothetical protein [Alicyclobacillus sp. SO9]|uniref:hypothetical protein n=1 Tax=Alicyclobacillus sp. SO9 TaxID=2665646 RepID=UPI0018E7EC5C|nr:hypothetical protein [Alicyclobacillus sp. SO9]QQE81527.1 hypothetical protein GI364_09870 [Alicyclobacillus sp. SO9]
MYGTFGGYTRWAVVFLIIFVLFFLLVPAGMAGPAGGGGVAVTGYHHEYGTSMGHAAGMHGHGYGMGSHGYGMMGHGYEGESSSSS